MVIKNVSMYFKSSPAGVDKTYFLACIASISIATSHHSRCLIESFEELTEKERQELVNFFTLLHMLMLETLGPYAQ